MGIEVFTDGSANANKNNLGYRKGGCAVVFTVNGEVKKTFNKGFFPTKTGRMELYAVLFALRMLAKNQKAIILSDSMYCVNCFNKGWLVSWEKQCWPDRLKNIDLLKKLLNEYRKFPPSYIKLRHVKGHQGVIGNELADQLANYKNFTEYEPDEFWLSEEEKAFFRSKMKLKKHFEG